jgi:hypothetical protein
MDLIEPSFGHFTFSKNRQRLLRARVSHRFFDFHGQQRSNQTHRSRSDPDARLYKKADVQAAKLSFLGHALMENAPACWWTLQ